MGRSVVLYIFSFACRILLFLFRQKTPLWVGIILGDGYPGAVFPGKETDTQEKVQVVFNRGLQ